MKKLLAIIVLGLIWSGSAFADNKKKDKYSVYLECKTPGGPYNGYGILRKISSVMVPQPKDQVDIVPLKITPSRYDFEYLPLGKEMPLKSIISINRYTGEMIEILETEKNGKKERNIFKGKCFKRDLDKPKF